MVYRICPVPHHIQSRHPKKYRNVVFDMSRIDEKLNTFLQLHLRHWLKTTNTNKESTIFNTQNVIFFNNIYLFDQTDIPLKKKNLMTSLKIKNKIL